MTQLLRVINHNNWFEAIDMPQTQRQAGLPADPLRDLNTSKNALSLYRVTDPSDFPKVVAGYATTRQAIQNLDYALFDEAALVSLDLDLEEEEGKTHGQSANSLHVNAVQLTAQNLVALAQVIVNGKIDRIPWKKIGGWVKQGIAEGDIDESKLPPKIIETLSKKF